jgi:hypothetical protein
MAVSGYWQLAINGRHTKSLVPFWAPCRHATKPKLNGGKPSTPVGQAEKSKSKIEWRLS